MVGPYRGLFATRGAKSFVIAGFVGRIPMSMLSIGITLLIHHLTGSFATAGALAAVVSLAYAVAAPLSGRLVDRYGQARVIVPFAVVHAAALTALMLLVHAHAPLWTFFLSAAIAGSSATSLGSMVRARWSHLLDDPARLHSAFSFESVADEVIFVAGPSFTAVVATSVNVYAGLIVAVVLATVGSLSFALLKSTEPPVVRRHERQRSPIGIPGVALLSMVMLAMGAVFGCVDVVTVSFAEEHGTTTAAGLLLACFSGGSMVSGLWYGARAWKITLRRRLTRALIVFVVGLTPVLLIGDLRLMALALFFAGLAISPTLITSFSLIERLVPSGQLTEGMSWLTTSIGFGVAVGAWAGGHLTDTYGASNAYGFAYGAALLAMVVGVAGSGWLRTPVAVRNSGS
ncbi:MFS transporter [Acrocarpospora catenulata]|uniref:MFS transporter n=1 Tax=Acrocarpospora catenulata TaxID=2836182 RepID=UPI001BDA1153|nr:MFS transporter [Acrocarpospora catenulata]